jgi:CHASE3 domain sensor protein
MWNSIWIRRARIATRLVIVAALTSVTLAAASMYQFAVDTDKLKTYERIAIETKDLQIVMLDAETGQRGFVITGDDGYLEVYRQALDSFQISFASLLNAADQDPQAHELVVEIGKLANSKIIELARVITVRRQNGFEPAAREVLTHLGKNLMDAFRKKVGALTDLAEHNVDHYRELTQEIARWAAASLTMAVASISLWISISPRAPSSRRRFSETSDGTLSPGTDC